VGDPDVPDGPNRPRSTYRLQLHAGFGFADVAALAGYLVALGVTHVYLSPILQAAPGSPHGYDVVDHSRISADLGGENGFRSMVAVLRRHGLGVVVDVVPNHMGIGAPEAVNREFWAVLAGGPGASCAHWFDVDWAARGGRLLLPILAGPLAACTADITVDRDGDSSQPGAEPVLRYFDHVLPLRPGTADLPLAELLDAQHYELADWRTAATDLNWRRFFDITTLIGIQVQESDVFAATHGLLLGLAAEGLIDGLRIDHPDGLADPRGYLRRLATATSGSWVVTEKILAGDEQLPADWECAGTTGYDTLAEVGGLFTDPAGAQELTREYVRFTAGPASFEPVAQAAKREIAGGSLAAEIAWLARVAARAGVREPDSTAPDSTAPDSTAPGSTSLDGTTLDGTDEADLRTVLAELVSAVAVYRAYVVPGEEPPPASVARLTAAAQEARDRLPARLHEALDVVSAAVLDPVAEHEGAEYRSAGQRAADPRAADPRAADPRAADPRAADPWAADPRGGDSRAELAVRFQQTCGPVMAKGVEDTAFYRWSRLTALNEVGGEPGRLGTSPREFHAFAARLARDWPATMTTLSSHDTKRGEDLRARLAVLAERPGEWAAEVARWHERAVELSTGEPGPGQLPEPETEYLMWQTLAGAWPIGPERVTEYLRKAMREAKTRTSWAEPDDGYEAAVLGLAEAVLADAGLSGRIAAFVAAIEPDARANSLGAKLVQLTMPGVPDIYQGCELGGFSLVDPDNRRPVDFERRRELLASLDDAGLGTTELGNTMLGNAGPDNLGLHNAPLDDTVLETAGLGTAGRDGGVRLDLEKLLVTSRALRLRRAHPDWFAGGYEPLAARGPAAEHAVAFVRGGHAVTVATRLPAGLRQHGGWAETVLVLPDGAGGPAGTGGPAQAWRDVITGTVHAGPWLDLGRLTESLPVALLVPDPVAKRPDHVF
jgi:(1->4)-alpha-D-glucan 1-alpha-D-glucosylmutase